MDVVKINGLCVRTEVGFSPHEQEKLQELSITIHLRTSIKKAGETDRVEDTINDKTITKEVLFHVENKTYNLIEAVATDVARICVVRHGVPSVKVIVTKPNASRFSESSSVTIERHWEDFDWHEAHILLGSNKDPLRHLTQAIGLLKKKVTVIKLSKAFWTKPVMAGDGADDFVDMAAFVKTKLDIVGLKHVLLDIECQLGRVHKADIDLDISFYGSDIAEYMLDCAPLGKQRVVPHPETLKEAYVIIPLADVTPDFPHPQAKKSLKTMAKEITGLEDFCSFYSTVQEKDFLGMIHNEMEVAHEGRNSCLTNGYRSLKEGYPDISESMSNGSPVSNEIPLGKEPVKMINPVPGTSKQNGDSLSGLTKSLSDVFLVNDFSVASPGLFKDAGHHDSPGVALVTGAAKRLGACIARKLHAAGYRIIIHYNKSKAEANNLLTELNSVRNNSASLIEGDLTCDLNTTAQRIITEAAGVWGRLDVLVNNASQYYATRLGSVTEEVWEDLVRANLTSPFFLSQAAYPFLKASKGSIVNLCDVHALRPKVKYSVYCITKAGLHMCTFSLAKEFAPDVRVNGVAPGCIMWPEESWDDVPVDERKVRLKENARRHQESISKVPFGRKGEPENVADAVLFLSKSAEYITGQIIAVDGGRSLHQ